MDEFLNSITHEVSTKTLQDHKRNIQKLEGINLHSSEKTIVSKIRLFTTNDQLQLIKTIMKYRRFYELPVETISQYFSKIKKEDTTRLQREKDDIVLPTREEIFKEINGLYLKEDYKSYIINYLLYHYSVRNLDLQLEIINNGDEIQPDKNYLIIMKTRIKYLRQNYKTHTTYGDKIITITNKDFYKAVIEYNDKYLLKTKNLTNELKKYIVLGLNETTFARAMLKDAGVKEADKIGKSRGTSLNVIEQHYT